MKAVISLRRAAMVAIVFWIVTPPVAADEWPSDWDRFRLWDQCRPMALKVFVDEGASTIGLTESAVTAAVQSRLRVASLYEKDGNSELFAGVQVFGVAFQVNIYFQKMMADPASKQIARAISWQDGSFGTHTADPGYILSSLTSSIDGFIDEYLRVNGVVCK